MLMSFKQNQISSSFTHSVAVGMGILGTFLLQSTLCPLLRSCAAVIETSAADRTRTRGQKSWLIGCHDLTSCAIGWKPSGPSGSHCTFHKRRQSDQMLPKTPTSSNSLFPQNRDDRPTSQRNCFHSQRMSCAEGNVPSRCPNLCPWEKPG